MPIEDTDRDLVVTGVSKIYPGTKALVDVDLRIHPGEVVALLGENGAGKSTLSSIIAGVTTPTTGSMTWQGEPYAPASPAEAIRVGIGLIHQETRLLPDLTVAENVVIGRWPTRSGFVNTAEMKRVAEKHLRRLGFQGSMDLLARDLSVAGAQQVEIAKALTLDARLLILDEPTAALGQAETDALFETVKSLREEGVSFIYVSHRLAEIAVIADRIVVLRDGQKIAEHAEATVHPDELVAQMVGRSVDRLFPDMPAHRPEVALTVEGLTGSNGRFENVSFQVHKGEVFGIAGIVGAGRTELVRAIGGADGVSSGRIELDGVPLRPERPKDAIAQGIVLIPEDRKHQGVILSQSIEENLVLPNMDRVRGALGTIAPKRVRAFTDEIMKQMRVKGQLALPASSMSGGNQQKIVIGKWLARDPKVVILDEPTRGIDVGARAAIYDVIRDLAARGTAVIVVSSDLDEVLGLASRVMVLARGRNQGILPSEDATANAVMALATR
ncbi:MULTISPECIES: sugar ABC transporter ATP-binding protein [Microbacterium]|uniref:sugar ABC transporter ATP-binding protein n=1 Tax=Microbacterium TaxID=33882 RepID=UPI0027817635|nr:MULTISPECIES: sugar ABC transporter ATP-binding protein [Microbacterium]MDQ1082527.1 ribose transport system ATP-binding protein [Microbacterium sp. SORGH_AS_0344]MDQ1168701.1 ribose transport system ATP-binding protein [Microbacterium proteolyticum]